MTDNYKQGANLCVQARRVQTWMMASNVANRQLGLQTCDAAAASIITDELANEC